VNPIHESRLRRQFIARVGPRRPVDVVMWFGAMQAQEYDAAKWAIGLRMPDGATDAEIDRAFDEGRILRTHAMRPTWHFVAPADIGWLLRLTGPRVQRMMASYKRVLELDERTLSRGTDVIGRALRDRRYLTRAELAGRLLHAGLSMSGPRLAHLVMHAELEGVICSGPRRGKQFTYALVSDRAPAAKPLSRDEALATLARRFFASHGPATLRDFVWWSGLLVGDAKRAVDAAGARRTEHAGLAYWTTGQTPRVATRKDRKDSVHLLPIYDEYLVAYKDREAGPHGPAVIASATFGPVNVRHALVIGGRVAGTWRVTRRSGETRLDVVALRRLSPTERGMLTAAVLRYERFLGTSVILSIG
jgi:hypothetical protein